MTAFRPDFRRPVGAERATLMLPLNVVMAARIRGHVDPQEMRSAVEKLRARHALLAVRVVMDAEGRAWYTTKDVPALPVRVMERRTESHWLETAAEEYRTSFPMDRGPLVRFALVHSDEVSELIVCGHHAICDGLSLAYLIRDILSCLATPVAPVSRLPLPPAVDFETVPSPPRKTFLVNAVIRLINHAWRRKGRRFDFDAMKRLHRTYWQANAGMRQLTWQLSESETTGLVRRSREHGVTVNSTLWAAFLLAQDRVQGSERLFRRRAGLAISTRDKLTIPVGESFGFYASSHRVLLRDYRDKPFWDAAETIHTQLKRSIDSTDPFRMLSATWLAPTLIDSLYFSKYGFATNRLSTRLLKKMMWDKVNYGCVITNVGRVDIPVTYGDLRLEAVYGPLVYSDVNEKTAGVITVGNRMRCWMSYNDSEIGSEAAVRFRDALVAILREAAA